MTLADVLNGFNAPVAYEPADSNRGFTPAIKVVPIYDEDGVQIGEKPAHSCVRNGMPPLSAIDVPDFVDMNDPVTCASISEITNNIGEMPMSQSPMDITDAVREFVNNVN